MTAAAGLHSSQRVLCLCWSMWPGSKPGSSPVCDCGALMHSDPTHVASAEHCLRKEGRACCVFV